MLTELRTILRTAARSLGVERAALTAAIEEEWGEAVGPDLATHTRPRELRGQIVWVDAEPGPWAQELSAQRTRVIADLNARLGNAIVRELRVRQRVGTQGYIVQKTKVHRAHSVELAEPSAEELAKIERILAEIRDVAVREAAKRAMISQLQWQKRREVRSRVLR